MQQHSVQAGAFYGSAIGFDSITDMFQPGRLKKWLAWPFALAFSHAQLELVRDYDPLPVAFAELSQALAFCAFVALQVLLVWFILFSLTGLAPFLSRGLEPNSAAFVTALAAVTISLVFHRADINGYLPYFPIALGALALALRRNADATLDRWFYIWAPGTLLLLSAIGFTFLWFTHFKLRSLTAGAPELTVLALAGMTIAAVAPLLWRAANLWARLGTIAASAAFVWPHAQLVLAENYQELPYEVPAQPSREMSIQHVILVVVDTLRADALSYRSWAAAKTPNLDALAQESVVFENAISAAPWTIPAMTTLMTGVAPLGETVEIALQGSEFPTLAELFQQHGYYNRAVVGNHLLYRPRSVARGFHRIETYAMRPIGDTRPAANLGFLFPLRFQHGGSTAHITAESLEFVKSAGDYPWFLWVHYFDPHDPYLPPTEYIPQDVTTAPLQSVHKDRAANPSVARRLYDAEVRFVDAEVGRLLGGLKKAGIYQDALIVLTSDHGEAFWEHGYTGHGENLYQELLHVPLLIRMPGGAFHQRIPDHVPTQALMPTLLDLCGIDHEPNLAWVPSLAPIIRGERSQPYFSPIVSGSTLSGEYQWSVVKGGMKYVWRLHSGREEIYDLESDPSEEGPITDDYREFAADARQVLKRHREFASTVAPPEQAWVAIRSGELWRRLKSLGYLQ